MYKPGEFEFGRLYNKLCYEMPYHIPVDKAMGDRTDKDLEKFCKLAEHYIETGEDLIAEEYDLDTSYKIEYRKFDGTFED
ncbi:MAG: hypothetical protein Q4P31_00910 [Andreesenia angusta]|nr:hypothetical protein [Andreesenia angusta]